MITVILLLLAIYMRPLLLLLITSTTVVFCNTSKTDPIILPSIKDQPPTGRTPVDREVVDTVLYLSDTTIRIDKYNLTFEKVDSLEIPELYQDYKERQEIVESNDNSFAAAKALEQYLIKKQGEHFRRSGETLLLNLSKGQTIVLKDNAQEGDEEERYTYENYFPETNAYLIRVQWYEGNNYLLVNRTNGSKKYVIGQIHPSSSGTQLLSVNEDLEAGYSFNGIQLLTKEEETFFTRFTFVAGNWAPVAVKWLDENNLILKVKKSLDDNLTEYKTEYYKLSIN